MPNFIPHDFNQDRFISISYEKQLPPGSFENILWHIVHECLDFSGFNKRYKNDHGGRAAYNPAILFTVVIYGYYKGINTSRRIADACRDNVIFKALSCDSEPHFTTIADFISSTTEEITELFSQVLLLCDQEGLLGKEVFAIDGCRMSSNAAKDSSGTFEELEKKYKKLNKIARGLVKKHQCDDTDDKVDSNDDRRESEINKINRLKHQANRIKTFLKENEPRIGARGQEVQSNVTDNESAKMGGSKGTDQGYNGLAAADSKHQIVIATETVGSVSEHGYLLPMIDAVRDSLKDLGTDSADIDDALFLADTGFSKLQNMIEIFNRGIKAVVPDNKYRQRDPIFENYERYKKTKNGKKRTLKPLKFDKSLFTYSENNKTCICPNGESLWIKNERIEVKEKSYIVFQAPLKACRNCPLQEQCMQSPVKLMGRQVRFSYSDSENKSAMDLMKAIIDSPEGKEKYSQRMGIIEPVFGNLRGAKKLREFTLRGSKKVNGQWKLYCMMHNLEKLIKYGGLQA